MTLYRVFFWRVALLLAMMGTHASGQTHAVSSPVLILPGVPDGIGHYVSETWGSIRFRINNPSVEPVSGTVVAYFEDDPTLQFARRVWLPPLSSRETSMAVLPPNVNFSANSREGKRSELKTFLTVSQGSGEILAQSPDEEKVYSSPIKYERGAAPILTITDLDPSGREDYELWLDAIGSAQFARFKSSQLIELPRDFLPILPETLKAARGLIVMGNRIASDPAGMSAIREWVSDGGSLWIMLDLVDASVVQKFLGDSLPITPFDRIGMNSLKVERSDRRSYDLLPREFNRAVEMIRLDAPNSQTIHSVDGWPASFFRGMGRGRIVATTLNARAWVRDRTGVSVGDFNGRVAKNEVTTPLLEVFDQFVEPTEQSGLAAEKFEPFITSQIGYRILERWDVLTVLGGYSVTLLLVGLWLRKRGKLERMLWIIPLLSAIASMPLALAATASRHSAPAVVSVAQYIERAADPNAAYVNGIAAMYQPQPWEARLASENRGTILPRQLGSKGKIRRLTWTDQDHAEWTNLDFPAGISTAAFHYPVQFDHPLEVRVRLGEARVTGSFPAELPKGLSDAVMVTSSERVIALQTEKGGMFHANERDVLAPRQYSAASMLSDEQRRRGEVLSRVFNSEGRTTKYPQTPTVFVWANLLPMPFKFPTEMEIRGSSLMALPVRLLPPGPGERFWIPPPLLDCRAIAAPASTGASVSFDNRKREWQEQSRPTDTWVRFQIPPELLPVVIDQVTLTIDINAPLRTVEVSCGQHLRMAPVTKQNEMVGQFTFLIDKSEMLQLDEQGGLLVRVEVSDLKEGSSGGREVGFLERRWKVNSLDLDVRARSITDGAIATP